MAGATREAGQLVFSLGNDRLGLLRLIVELPRPLLFKRRPLFKFKGFPDQSQLEALNLSVVNRL